MGYKLAIIEAGVVYNLYFTSVVNWMINRNKGFNSTEYQNDVERRASELHVALAACLANVIVPHFDNPEAIFANQAPFLETIADSLCRAHSEEEGKLFLFCSLIGGLALAKDVGITDPATSSAAETQIRLLGQTIGLPQDVIDGCIRELGFGRLQQYFKGESTS